MLIFKRLWKKRWFSTIMKLSRNTKNVNRTIIKKKYNKLKIKTKIKITITITIKLTIKIIMPLKEIIFIITIKTLEMLIYPNPNGYCNIWLIVEPISISNYSSQFWIILHGHTKLTKRQSIKISISSVLFTIWINS